jgi:hypothetical protein
MFSELPFRLTEKHLCIDILGEYRSAYAKFRAGALRIETARYERLEVNERLCFNCSRLGINVVEDEKHVLLQFPGYADIRQSILNNICELNSNFINMSDNEKFLYMFHNENVCYFTAKICHEILFKRIC